MIVDFIFYIQNKIFRKKLLDLLKNGLKENEFVVENSIIINIILLNLF